MANEIQQLPALLEPDASGQPASYRPAFEQDAASIPISHYFWVLRRHAWKIAVFVATSLVVTFLISSRLTPIYEATATINIDRQAPSAVLGDGTKGDTGMGDDLYVMTQMKIMESDAVVRPVSRKFNLLDRESQTSSVPNSQLEALRSAPVSLRQLRISRPPNTLLITISYRSTDPQLSADVANAVAQSYLENIYRIQANSAGSAATFMTKQLDEL